MCQIKQASSIMEQLHNQVANAINRRYSADDYARKNPNFTAQLVRATVDLMLSEQLDTFYTKSGSSPPKAAGQGGAE